MNDYYRTQVNLNNVTNLHNCKSKALNRNWVATNIEVWSSSPQVTNWVWQVHSEHRPQLRIRQVYRWSRRSHTMRASQNLQSAKFWWWWIQLLLFTPTSYDCTRTGRQLLQSVTSNNANNSNDQHLQQIIPTPSKTGSLYLDLFLAQPFCTQISNTSEPLNWN